MENQVHICENCGKEHDGSYGSGRFCSNHCRHVFIGKQTKRHVCNWSGREPKEGGWDCLCGLNFKTRRLLQVHRKECVIINDSNLKTKNTNPFWKEIRNAKLKNRICIHFDDIKNKRIKYEFLDDYLSQGWETGLKIKNKLIVIHSEENRKIISEKLKKYYEENPEKFHIYVIIKEMVIVIQKSIL